MLPQQKRGWTTIADLDLFRQTTWSYLTNVKMTWEYNGIAYLFRNEGIALYGKDLGSMKMNHPIACMAIPQYKDKNYGVDLYVPVESKKRAVKLIEDKDRLKECSLLEEEHGEEAHRHFEQDALAFRARDAKRERGRARRKKRGILKLFKTRSDVASQG